MANPKISAGTMRMNKNSQSITVRATPLNLCECVRGVKNLVTHPSVV